MTLANRTSRTQVPPGSSASIRVRWSQRSAVIRVPWSQDPRWIRVPWSQDPRWSASC